MNGLGALASFLGVLAVASSAAAWEPFRVENSHVADGNERLAAQDADGALHHYDQAVEQLPSEPGVHLDRGLALLEGGQLDEAIEEFERASRPPASRELRADALYDTGIAYYRQGDAAATEENHEEAQRLFREAADAFRRSLRLRPGNRDAGWNLELALRRLREQEEQQQEEDDQQQDDQEQDDQEQDDQEQDDQEQDDQEQDDQQQDDQQQDDQQQDDQQQNDQQQDDQQQDDQQQDDQQGGDQESDDEQESEQEGPQDGEGGEDGDQQPPPRQQEDPGSGTQERSLPPEHRRVLDALQDSEENLERHRARTRARQENRRVEQDW